MSTVFKSEIEINASKEKVWQALSKVGDICHGHPAVETSHLTSTQTEGVGTTRHCNLAMMGATSEERVIEWVDGEYMKIEAYEINKMPGIKDMFVDFAVRQEGDKSVLTSTMEYSMKNPFFDVMNTLVMKKMNGDILNGIVAGHKKYIEDGEIVTQKTVLEMDKVVKLI
ncbi:MAG: SRPBCC family protein [Chloroflexi bacterium]|nr:SRPBCC family protein [Chloroflexota bacterium]